MSVLKVPEVVMNGIMTCFLGFFIASSFFSGQSLFEKAEAGREESSSSLELNGWLRSVLFLGKIPHKDEGEIKKVRFW